MRRLALDIPLPIDLRQAAVDLFDSDGTCICGRILKPLDGRLFLCSVVPNKNISKLAAYCLNCARVINHALLMCKSVVHSNTETAPVEIRGAV